MKKLSTIQKREKLNNIYIFDEKGNGGANHHYNIRRRDNGEALQGIVFQNGARRGKFNSWCA